MSEIDLITTEDLDEPGREALRRLVLTLADSKRMMGIRYSDWLLGAPSIEAGIAASSMAQDEWGHARLLYAMLKGFGIDPVEVEHDRPPEAYASMAALDEPLANWAAIVTAMVVVDGALSAVLGSFADGRFESARSRVPKMLAEEEFHASLGAAWFKRLARSGEARPLLVEACDSLVPTTLAWVGADDGPMQTLVSRGVLGAPADRRDRFEEAVAATLAEAGVDLGAHTVSDAWDEERGRTVGQPDAESVERARGDRNRALFVE